ncbi:hypothetical protein GGD66_006909 [Bradyrhizobium sp. CIR48]|nr:hypothetical protein [Bradyrhizobium sp. CIR48]
MPAVGRPGGFANVGRGRYATRPGSGRWVIANHLLVEKAQTRAQMLHQWDQRTCTDARQIGGVRAGSDRRLGKIRRRDPNRPRPAVRQRDNDVGGTAPRPLLQHLKPVPKKKMMRVGNRDVRHDPFKNRGTLTCSPTPRSAMPYWTASFTTPTASSSKVTACVGGPTIGQTRDHRAPDRPTGPQVPPARAAASLVGATPRHARGPPMDRWNDLQTLTPVLTRQTISRTHKHVSRVRLRK